MSNAAAATETLPLIIAPRYSDAYNVPHRYMRPGTPNWRTCEGCGAGANAKIHRAG